MEYNSKTQNDVKKLISKYISQPAEYDIYLSELFNIIKDDEDLTSCVDNLIIYKNNIKFGSCARYSSNKKAVGIMWNSFTKDVNYHTSKLIDKVYYGDEINYDKLGFMALILIHELSHAKQKQIIENERTYESKLLHYVYDYFDKIGDIEFFDFYKKNHDLLPNERMAQLSALKLVSQSLNESVPVYSNISLYYKKFLAYSQLKGYTYGSGSSPLIEYLNLINQSDLEINNNCTLDDKLYYGLPITKEEYIEKSKVLKIKYNR